MTLNSLLDQILNQSNELDESNELDDFYVDNGNNECFEGNPDDQITQELVIEFQNKLRELSRRAKQGADPNDLFEFHQEILRDLTKYTRNVEDDQGEEYPNALDLMDPLMSPETFQDFIDYYQKDCLGAIKARQSVFGYDLIESYSLYVNFNEILLGAVQGRKSAKASRNPQTAGMTLGLFLVDTAQTEALGVIAGMLQEYPQTLTGTVDIPISQSVKKEIREKLWKTTFCNLNEINKNPRICYHFVFDPVDIMDLMLCDITTSKNVGVLRIDNSDGELAEKYPLVKNVNRFLENNKGSGSSFSMSWNQEECEKYDYNSYFLLLDGDNVLTCPPLNFRIEYGPLPSFDLLLSSDPDAPLELTTEVKLATQKTKQQTAKAKEKTSAKDAPKMFFVRVRKINSVPKGIPAIDLTFCVNRPVLSKTQALQIVRSGSFHWMNEQIQTALNESQKLPARYALNLDGQTRLGFFYTSIPHIQEMQIRALLSENGSPAEVELGSTIAALDHVLLKQKKTYSLETYRDFYLSLAKAGGFKDSKPNAVPSWKELWKGWGLMTDSIQEIVDVMKKCRQ